MICCFAKYSKSKKLKIIPVAEQYQAIDSPCDHFQRVCKQAYHRSSSQV